MIISLNSKRLKRNYNKETNTLSFYLSDITDTMEEKHLYTFATIINKDKPTKDSRRMKTYKFVSADKDGTKEDIYGWNFQSADRQKLLIIND